MTRYLDALQYCLALRVIWEDDFVQITKHMMDEGFSEAETSMAIAHVLFGAIDDYELVIVQTHS